MPRRSLVETLDMIEAARDYKPPTITRTDAIARTGLNAKQFNALVHEGIFPAPQSKGRWDRNSFNITLGNLKGPPTRSATGYVYFMEMGDFIKIGYSAWPPQRREDLQVANPYDIILLGAFPGTLEGETAFHQLFGHCHRRGEWFHKTPGLLAFIAWLKIAWHGTGADIRGDLDNVVRFGEKTGTALVCGAH